MIVATPKFNTFFALGVFLVLTYGVTVYMLYDWWHSAGTTFWFQLLLLLVIGIAITVTVKFATNYKVVMVDKNRVDVVRMRGLIRRRLYFKDLLEWNEEVVRTSNGVFKQLTAKFINNKRLKLANQEHNQYEKVLTHFRKYHGKKEIKR